MILSRIAWYFKQLLPLSYWTEYVENGQRIFVIWRMWFGRSYEIVEFDIVERAVED